MLLEEPVVLRCKRIDLGRGVDTLDSADAALSQLALQPLDIWVH